MSVYKKYIMPVVVSVTLIGGYNWMTKPETMNDHLIVVSDAELNAIEPAMGPAEEIAVSVTEVIEAISITEAY
ncbi:MAG: hypothetical protein VX730_03535 [Pseudomonadota bacterium]|nr:hypothetical protein [Pseudomonadota bacterium]